MELLNDYLLPVVSGICLCTGYIIKKWIPDVDNKYIPTFVSVLGIVIAIWANEFRVTPEVILGGLFSGLTSTGMYELLRQNLE